MSGRTEKPLRGIVGRSAAVLLLALTGSCTDLTGPVVSVPSAIVIEPGALELDRLGAGVEIRARVVDERGEPIEGALLRWTAEGSLALAGDEDTGALTLAAEEIARFASRANGRAVVTARLVSGSAAALSSAPVLESTIEINVQQRVEGVELEAAGALWAIGAQHRVETVLRDANGFPVEREVPITWSSADESIATVDADGTVTATGEGTVAITAEAEGQSATASFVVSPIVRTEICAQYRKGAEAPVEQTCARFQVRRVRAGP